MDHATPEQRILELASRRVGSGHAPATLQEPVVPESLGEWLAAELRRFEPRTIVLWSDVEAAVLGHVVARELGARVVHAFADEGVLTLNAATDPGENVALVAYDWSGRPGLGALVQLVQNTRAVVVAAGSVLATEHGHEHVPAITLDPGANR